MKAIIFNSGLGTRLRPLTNDTPKCLIDLGGFSILERMINSLKDNNVKDIVITTGYLEDKIKSFVKAKYPDLNVVFVNNPIYDKTNYIYSMWLAREALKDSDTTILHGDLVYDPKLLTKVLEQEESSALIKQAGALPEKDFKAEIQDNMISKIGVDIFGDNAKFCAPLYKFSADDLGLWFDKIGEFVKAENINCYAENAFNELPDLKIKPVYYDNELCSEIDDHADLERVKALLKSNK